MPLSAFINNVRVQSFNYSDDEWDQLKKNRSSLDIRMICCQNRGILRTSPLGTHFFAHYRKGDCDAPAESKEQLLAKNIIAKTVQECGWKTSTEYNGKTPDGEDWKVDVYAERGKTKIAFEVQLTHQSDDEYQRMQKQFIDSGIRCAWFSNYRKNDIYFYKEHDYELPKFSIQFVEENTTFVVKDFDVELSSFIRGLLSGKLKIHWHGKSMVNAGLIVVQDECWRCKKWTNLVLGIAYIEKDSMNGFGKIGVDSEYVSFGDVHQKTYSKVLPDEIRKYHKIGVLKERYSKTIGGKYFSNGCFFCDALMGDHFLNELELELRCQEEMPQPQIFCDLIYGEDLPETLEYWTYDGKKSVL